MPRTPQPPRKGHPARPPKREDEAGATRAPSKSASKPRSYGQSAPMPGQDDAPIEGETRAPARKIARREDRHESVEELAGEPMREEGEDEPK